MSKENPLSFKSLLKVLANKAEQVEDKRAKEKVKHSVKDTVLSGYAMMYLQDPSLLQFQKSLFDQYKLKNLQNQFGVRTVPKDTQLRKVIDGVDSTMLMSVITDFCKVLYKQKELIQYRVLGNYYYIPLDATGYFSSKNIECESCLKQVHEDGSITRHHQVLQGGIVSPRVQSVIPFAPEPIANTDGSDKQDCKINAFKRIIPRIKEDYPFGRFTIGGDSLYSKKPVIDIVRKQRMDYIFRVKSGDHKYLFEWVAAYPQLSTLKTNGVKEDYLYEWVHNVPLNGQEDTPLIINFVCFTKLSKKGSPESSMTWVTSLSLSKQTIEELVAVARTRWKNENEFFNVLKNHGYGISRNYGHGKNFLSLNFYLLTLIAFFMHQIFELADAAYQAARQTPRGPERKDEFFNCLRMMLGFFIFHSWDDMLQRIIQKRMGNRSPT